jgi:acyl carrier protein
VLLIKAVALALREVPELNGYWIDGGFKPGAGIHVGSAISLRGGGLVAPALHDADKADLTTLMRTLQDVVARARAGSLRSSEFSDPTITVTNLGDQGCRVDIWHHLSAAGRAGRFWEDLAATMGGFRHDRGATIAHSDALCRSSRERRTPRRRVPHGHRPVAADSGEAMTPDEIKPVIVDALMRIAPEIEPGSIESGTSFRDQLDLDSMDFLNFVLALHDRLGIEIPEADYPRLYTLDGAVAYLASKTGANRPERAESVAPSQRSDPRR